MDFFEALRKRTKAKLGDPVKYKAQGEVAQEMYETVLIGIAATIEALKEITVGKPIVIKPSKSVARRIFVQAIEQASANGEEVIVLILREEANLTNL